MGYRDDLEAVRQRVTALEHELKATRRELGRLRDGQGADASMADEMRHELDDSRRQIIQLRRELEQARSEAGLHDQYRLAAALEASGRGDDALTVYLQALRLDPSHVPSLAGAARLFFVRRRYQEARAIYSRLLLQRLEAAVGLSRADVYHRLGEIHLARGEWSAAIDMFERGLVLDANHRPLWSALGEARRQAKAAF